jgi:hypothetical protein
MTRNSARVRAFVTMRRRAVEFRLQHAGANVISERFADMNQLLDHARLVRQGFEASAWVEER